MTTGAGQTVRVAQGVVRINVTPLAGDARQAVGHFGTISNAGKQIGVGVRQGSQAAQSSLKELTTSAQSAMGQLARLFALPTLIGVTQNVKQIEFTIRALAGSEQKANQQLDIMRQLADRTGQSFFAIQKAALGILPSISRTNVDLEQTLLLTQRLAILDPLQGIEGAGFALRELLGGSTVSLAQRFELPKQQLNQLLESAGGDPQKIIDGLDAIVAKMGITEETIVEAGEAGLHSFTRLKDELILTTAEGFQPMLDNGLIPLVEGFGDLLAMTRQANPELLQIAGTLAGILATMTALNAVGMGGKWTTGLAVAAGAGFAGIEAGTAIARYGAESGGFQNKQLENVSQEEAKKVIEETAKRLVLVIANGTVDVAMKFVEGAVIIGNAQAAFAVALEDLKAIFEDAKKVVETSFENSGIVLENAADKLAAALEVAAIDIESAFRGLLEGVGQLIVDLPIGMDDKGREIIDAARAGAPSEQERAAAVARRDQDITAGTTSIGSVLDGLWTKIADFAESVRSTDIGLTDAQRDNLAISEQELRTKFVIPVAETLNILEDEVKTWAERIQGTEVGGGGVAPVEEFTTEMLEAFAKFQKELAELEKKADADRKKANQSAFEDRQKAEAKLNDGISKTITESNKRRDTLIKDAAKQTEEAEAEHRARLANIQSESDRDALRAVANIDAVALRAALEKEKEAVDAEQTGYEKQKAQRHQELAAQLDDLKTTGEERIAALRLAYQQEVVEIESQRQARLAQIRDSLRSEIEQRNQAFAELHNRLAAEAQAAGNHGVRMLNIQGQDLAAREKAYRDWIARQGGYVPQAAPATPQQVAQAVQAVSSFKVRLPSFAEGIGNTGKGGPAMLHPFEGVMNETTATMMRSMTGSQNPSQAQMQAVIGGSSQPNLQIGTIVFPGDVGQYSRAELDGLMRAHALSAFQEVIDQWKK